MVGRRTRRRDETCVIAATKWISFTRWRADLKRWRFRRVGIIIVVRSRRPDQVSPMIEKRRRTEFSKPLPAEVSLRVIRGYAHRVAQRFRPEKIILFGSHAYGEPNADSDVDLLVVMPARNQLDQAAKIRIAVPAPFAMDLIVRTPKRMRERLGWGDSFITEIASKGKVLYEEIHVAMR